MVYRHTIDATSYVFDDLRDLLAKATPLRSGDRLAGIAADSAEQKLAQLMRVRAGSEAQGTKKVHCESVEAFVQRQNIEHYRALLKSQPLDETRRHTIEKLLSEEEAKFREGQPGSSVSWPG